MGASQIPKRPGSMGVLSEPKIFWESQVIRVRGAEAGISHGESHGDEQGQTEHIRAMSLEDASFPFASIKK